LSRWRDDRVLAEARETTNRVARTFSLACRLLPDDVRDDVYRLYLVFRTLDDLVDERDPLAQARVE
jgi:phytoene synthase